MVTREVTRTEISARASRPSCVTATTRTGEVPRGKERAGGLAPEKAPSWNSHAHVRAFAPEAEACKLTEHTGNLDAHTYTPSVKDRPALWGPWASICTLNSVGTMGGVGVGKKVSRVAAGTGTIFSVDEFDSGITQARMPSASCPQTVGIFSAATGRPAVVPEPCFSGKGRDDFSRPTSTVHSSQELPKRSDTRRRTIQVPGGKYTAAGFIPNAPDPKLYSHANVAEDASVTVLERPSKLNEQPTAVAAMQPAVFPSTHRVADKRPCNAMRAMGGKVGTSGEVEATKVLSTMVTGVATVKGFTISRKADFCAPDL